MNFLILLVLSILSSVQPMNVYVQKIQNLILDTINEPAPDFVPCNEDVLQKATFGDMIEIKRARGYFHWCVLYKDETVINFDNPDFDKLTVGNVKDNFTGYVQLRNLKELAGDDFCRINNKISESKRRGLSTLSVCQTTQLMKEKLEHNVTWYNVINYNCEHFATELKFGVPFSSQVGDRILFT